MIQPREEFIQELVKFKANEEFTKELEQLLNRHGVDNLTETPDFILAEHLTRAIEHIGRMNAHTRVWKGQPEWRRP